jgi:hypothetical protein
MWLFGLSVPPGVKLLDRHPLLTALDLDERVSNLAVDALVSRIAHVNS